MKSWENTKLSDVITLVSGFAYKSTDWQDSGVPVLKITNVRNGRVNLEGCSYISSERAIESKNFQVVKGDLLITLTGEIGATGFYLYENEARLNQRVGKLTPKRPDSICLPYLAFFLESPRTREIMWATAKGIAQANISPKEILSLEIPLPSIEKQWETVSMLQSHLSRLDGIISDVNEVKRKSFEFRRSLLHSTFMNYLDSEK
jgi:type I restriction enzyme S subunit